MIILIIVVGLIFVSQLIYWTKPFITEEDKEELYDASNPCVYYSNKYFGIAFHDITKDARLLGWQWMDDGTDKCIYFCTIGIVFNFLRYDYEKYTNDEN